MSRDYWGAVRRGPHEQLPPEALVPEECDREHQQTSKFLDDVRGGLEKRGYADLGDAYGSLASADGIFEIALYPHNIYDRANPVNGHPFNGIENAQAREAALVACSDMPSGPILVLFPRDRFFAEEGSDSLDTALQKAGLSKTDYEALKVALFLARMYTKPEWRQAAEAAAGDDPAGRQALAVQLANADLTARSRLSSTRCSTRSPRSCRPDRLRSSSFGVSAVALAKAEGVRYVRVWSAAQSASACSSARSVAASASSACEVGPTSASSTRLKSELQLAVEARQPLLERRRVARERRVRRIPPRTPAPR